MNLYMLAGAGVVAALLALAVRQYRKELGTAVALAAGLLLMLYAVVNLTPVLRTVRDFTERASLDGTLFGVLLRTLGVCWLTQFAADLCRDAGESALATVVETAGAVCALLVSLPLLRAVLELLMELMG